MPKIITFTANILAETTYEYPIWAEGNTQRANAESFQVGGKGINVAKMLNRLEAENAALCFPGGSFGPMCEDWMEANGIRTMPFREGCRTRSGSVVRAPKNGETTFLGEDSLVSEEAVQAAMDGLQAEAKPFVLAICGSVQSWMEMRWDPLRRFVEERDREQVILAVDNYGPSLDWLAKQGASVVKLNRQELETLFSQGVAIKPTDELLKLAAEQYDCPRWVVTDGGGTIWIKDGDAAPESFEPPKVKSVSATGSGDVFFATLLDCLYNKDGYGLRMAAERAADFASRNASTPGIAEFVM